MAFTLLYGTILIWVIVMAFGGLIGFAMWIFRSLAVYRIASRRGIANAWLSWIPVGRDWILGSISDQYQYLVCGKVKNKRKLMLGFSGVTCVVCIICIVMAFHFVAKSVMMASAPEYYMDEYYLLSMSVGMLVFYTVALGLSITIWVFRCMSKYDLYRSCDPNNALAYLVLAIIFVILDPIFLFVCRNKDQGMPPRRPGNSTYVDTEPPTYL